MKYKFLGRSGLQVSLLGLGTNSFGKRADARQSTRILHLALDQGINFIDTANIYAGTQSETIIGEALVGRRDQVVLATKAGLIAQNTPNGKGSSRFHLQQQLEESLRRLKTDYIDLYQIHTFDPYTPLEETLRTLDDMVSSGKVRYIGASNYAAWELMKALSISEHRGWERFISTQASYSLADRTPELELVPCCLDQGVGIIPYFPLAGGILTGKYVSHEPPAQSRGDVDPNFKKYISEDMIQLGGAVQQLAAEYQTDGANVSLAWLMAQEAVSTVIVGATSPEQLQSNLQSVTLTMDAELQRQLDMLSKGFVHSQPFAQFRLI